MSILTITLKTKAYRNYTKRTLIILRYKYLKMLIGLYSEDLNNYSDAIEYGFIISTV
jgi:hypothetical protein